MAGFLASGDPPQLARLGACRLPNLDEQHIVSSIAAAFENNLRPIVRLRIDGKELGCRMRNYDEIATTSYVKFRVGHCQAVLGKASFKKEYLHCQLSTVTLLQLPVLLYAKGQICDEEGAWFNR